MPTKTSFVENCKLALYGQSGGAKVWVYRIMLVFMLLTCWLRQSLVGLSLSHHKIKSAFHSHVDMLINGTANLTIDVDKNTGTIRANINNQPG